MPGFRRVPTPPLPCCYRKTPQPSGRFPPRASRKIAFVVDLVADSGRRDYERPMLDPKDLERRIAEALPGASVEVVDTTGTGDHFLATVVCEAFTGKSLVERHQMVYAPLRADLDSGALHALALKTFTPEQWKARAGA